MRFINSIKSFDDSLAVVEKTILIIIVFTMIAMAVTQIILRNGFGFGIIWADSFIRTLVLWAALISAMLAARTNEHIKIDIILHKIPDKYLPLMTQLLSLFVFFICIVASYYSIQFVIVEQKFPSTAFAEVPTWICVLIIPIFFIITGLRYLLFSITGSHRVDIKQ